MRLIVLCAAATGGLLLGDLAPLEPRRWLFMALLALVGASLTWHSPRWRLLALMTGGLALGAARASSVAIADRASADVAATLISPYVDRRVSLLGRVIAPPTVSSTGRSELFQLDVEAIDTLPPAPSAATATRASPTATDSRASPTATGSRTSPTATDSRASPTATGSRTSPTATASQASPATTGSRASPAVPASGASPVAANSLPPLATSVRVRVVADPSASLDALQPGDEVQLDGRMVASSDPRGPPALLFPVLVARQPAPGAQFSPTAVLAGVRATAESNLRRSLPDPQAGLTIGVLLGDSGQVDADLRRDLQRSGLAHLLAIDGFKQVAVAAALGAVAVRLLGARLAIVPVLLGIAGYTLLTGAHPSAVRAALMVGLASLAALGGRVADPLTSLSLAVLAMAALDPPVLRTVALQLSVSAVLGIVLGWPRLRPCLKHLPRSLAEPIGLTLAVTLASLPVVLSVFNQVSLISPIAHVAVAPLLPMVLVSSGALAAVAGMPVLGMAVGWLTWLAATLLIGLVRACGELPGAALSTGRLPAVAAIGLAVVLLAGGLLGLPEAASFRRGLRQTWASHAAWGRTPLACMAGCLGAATVLCLVRPDGHLHVSRLSAGRGQAVFIRGPTGRTALVLGGRADTSRVASGVADHLAVWEHTLDTLIWLDAPAGAALGDSLGPYAPERSVGEQAQGRLDLGGGAVLDLDPPAPSAPPALTVAFGSVRIPIGGQLAPPAPGASTDTARTSGWLAASFESNGDSLWRVTSGEP